MDRPRALVIGGSLGGLFAANLLRMAGWEAVVFERVSDDLASRGAGIGTHEELFRVMRRLGLPIDRSIGVEVGSRVCLDRSGAVTHELALTQFMSAWARIYRPLREALPAAGYCAGMTLQRIEQNAQGVTAVFADGTRASGDLLVGADGIHSTVRAQFLPGVQPRYAGYVAWRGLVDERSVSPEIVERYIFCLPDGEIMLCYPVPGRDDDTRVGRRGYNFVWYRPVDLETTLPQLCTDAAGRRHGLSIPPPLIRPEIVADLKASARALLAPQVADVVAHTAQPFFQPIFDLESSPLVFGRVVLLGDAAFVARPHVGVGVTKAALDAECLADSVATAGSGLDEALAHYNRQRSQFGMAVVARARRLGAHLEAQLKPPAERGEAGGKQRPEIVLREMGSRFTDVRDLAGSAPSR
jgi:2-polyprenyl-6-methoxyphenol hydroxylase-like FAD-dependent oxidoreductase